MADAPIPAIAVRLRQMRDRKGYTLKEAADRISDLIGKRVHFTTIGKLETGKMGVSVEWIDAFASAYDVTVEQLFLGEDVVMPRAPEPAADSKGEVAVPAEMAEFVASKLKLEALGISAERARVSVNTKQRRLADGAIYQLRVANRNVIATYRAEDMTFAIASGDAAVDRIVVGEHPFEIKGRVVSITLDLPSEK